MSNAGRPNDKYRVLSYSIAKAFLGVSTVALVFEGAGFPVFCDFDVGGYVFSDGSNVHVEDTIVKRRDVMGIADGSIFFSNANCPALSIADSFFGPDKLLLSTKLRLTRRFKPVVQSSLRTAFIRFAIAFSDPRGNYPGIGATEFIDLQCTNDFYSGRRSCEQRTDFVRSID